MSKSIMFQGTASNVGKSIVTAGICRILKQDGYSVAPFKSQNMALNSYITKEGLEMGRAQVIQAEACKIEPSVKMNPILLKPTGNGKSQVILNGKVHGDMNSFDYHDFKPQLLEMLKETFEELNSKYEVIVMEGAGSAAEINLKDRDVVNMGMAEIVDAPVVLIGDIDRGGVFASLAGTMLLFTEEERKRVKGVIINKFRGDVKLLESGIKMLEEIIKVPVLGVIPHANLNIEDEDSVTERFNKLGKNNDIEIGVLRTPYMSNFTDMNIFETQGDVNLRYIKKGELIGDVDMLILPGTKSTIDDLIYIRENGYERQINDLHKKGKLIFGICGGYQMLGKILNDPYEVESNIKAINGLGLLNIETTFEKEKVTTQVEAKINDNVCGYLDGLNNKIVNGYEIHMGISKNLGGDGYLNTITKKLGSEMNYLEGTINKEGNVIGTYLHGIFDDIDFTRGLLNNIRKEKGLENIESAVSSFEEFKEKEYDKLADLLRKHLDMKKIYEIING